MHSARITIIILLALLLPTMMFGDDKLTGTTIYSGSVSTGVNNAFDNRLDTYFATNETEWTWVGLDLGEKHIITEIGYAPRSNADYGPERMVLGIFEGANSPDFMDAVPLRLIGSQPECNKITTVGINVSRGFRYVRYVTPNGGKCNIAEMQVYGHKGEGDDSHFYQITTLPTVSIHVANNVNPPNDKQDYTSNITITYENGTLIQEYPILTRVRGNYSATWENKPYRIKFNDDKKHHMLKDSPEHQSPAKAKKWTLISSYGDKTLMRNPVSYEISRRIGMPFTPWCKPVDLILNGEYRGTYQLTDHVDIKADRVNITEMTEADTEGDALTGGYLIEMNGYANSDPVHFTSSRGNPVSIHSPEDDVIQEVQRNYIVDHFNDMESRVFGANYTDPELGYRKKLDLTSFLKYFLSNEFSSNTDYLWQVYMFKQRGDDHIYTGPVWDNDLSLENDGNYYPGNQKTDWVYKVRGAGDWRNLVTRVLSDGNAMAKLKGMWAQLRKREVFTAENIAAYVDSLREEMSASAALNFQRWPYLYQQVHCNPRVYDSWDEEVDNVRDYVYGRVGWMDGMLSLSLKQENGYYLIASAQDMCTFADMINAGQTDIKVKLTADIDFSETPGYSPAGSLEKPFRGLFDGQGHYIHNLTITGNDGIGIFAALGDGAKVMDVGVGSSCSFIGSNYVGTFAGAIVAPGAVTFERAGTEAHIIAANEYAGGFAGGYYNGHSIAYITNCYNMAQVDALANTDAFIGEAGDTRLNTCYNGGLVKGQKQYMVVNGEQFEINDEQLVSGEICFRLSLGGSVWRQNIDNGRQRDAFPVPFHNHGVVFETDGHYTNINPNAKGFRYYKLAIEADKGAGVIQMAEFDLLDATGDELPTLTAYNGNVEGFGSEQWTNLTDNNVDTKYCAPMKSDMFVMFDAGVMFDAYGYRIYTANDTHNYPGRNPGSWKLYGSDVYTEDAESTDWILIDEVGDDDKLGATNFTPYNYYLVRAIESIDITPAELIMNPGDEASVEATIIPATMAYATLDWMSTDDEVATVTNEGVVKAVGVGECEVKAIATDNGNVEGACKIRVTNENLGYRYYLWQIAEARGGVIQMAEFALLDDDANENKNMTVYAGTESNITRENWPNIADHDVSSKYCSSSDRAPFMFFFDAQYRMKPSAYRIYTANDTEKYPERNPATWTLWGSNTMTSNEYDSSWVLIDKQDDDNVLGATNYTPYNFPIIWPEEPSGIVTIKSEDATRQIYDIEGRKRVLLHRGLNIVRMPDGNVRKIIVR